MKGKKKPENKEIKPKPQTEVEFICENCNQTYQKDLIMSSQIKCPECQSLKLFYTDQTKNTGLAKIQSKIKKLFGKT